MVDSHAMVRNNTDRFSVPWPSFPQWWHLTELQYNITTRILASIQSINPVQTSPVLLVHICVHVCSMQFYHVRRFMYVLSQSRHTVVPKMRISCVALLYHTHLPLAPSPPLTPNHFSSLLYLYTSIISGMLWSQNHIVYNLLGLALSLRMTLWGFRVVVYVNFLLLSSSLWYGCTMVYFNTQLLKSIGLFPVFGYYKLNHLEHSCIVFVWT